jgi:hypothetical protein
MPASLVLGQTPAGLRQLPPSQPLHFACAAGQQRWLPCSVFTATSSGEGQQLQRSVGSCSGVKIVQLCGLQTPRVRPEHRPVWPYRLLWLSPLSLPRLSCKSLPSPGRHNKRGAAGGVPHRHQRPLIGAPVSGGCLWWLCTDRGIDGKALSSHMQHKGEKIQRYSRRR